MPREPKRRFLALDVGEVSLVDTPANEREWLVTKNSEESDMDGEASENTTTNSPAAERVPVAVSDGQNVEKALGHVRSIVAEIAKMANVKLDDVETDAEEADVKKEEPAKAAEPTDEDLPEETVSKNGFPRGKMAKTLRKSGLTGDALKSALDELEKCYMGTKSETKKDAEVTTEKASTPAPETKETPAAESAPPADVEKAKTFTPDRIGQIAKAAEALVSLLKDVAPTPAAAVETKKAEEPNPSAKDDAILKALEELKQSVNKSVTDLAGRVETIEKTRGQSNAVETDTTDTKTQKSGSIWSSVL